MDPYRTRAPFVVNSRPDPLACLPNPAHADSARYPAYPYSQTAAESRRSPTSPAGDGVCNGVRSPAESASTDDPGTTPAHPDRYRSRAGGRFLPPDVHTGCTPAPCPSSSPLIPAFRISETKVGVRHPSAVFHQALVNRREEQRIAACPECPQRLFIREIFALPPCPVFAHQHEYRHHELLLPANDIRLQSVHVGRIGALEFFLRLVVPVPRKKYDVRDRPGGELQEVLEKAPPSFPASGLRNTPVPAAAAKVCARDRPSSALVRYPIAWSRSFSPNLSRLNDLIRRLPRSSY